MELGKQASHLGEKVNLLLYCLHQNKEQMDQNYKKIIKP